MASRATTAAAAPARPMLGALERAAWRVPLSSPRFFITLAIAVCGVIAASSGAAAVVAGRNADVVVDARDRWLRIATSVTAFRGQLSAADDELGTTLVSGQPETPLGRARHEAELLRAGPSLTDAGLVATGDSADDVAALAERLARYATLVETSRAYPVGSTFADLARTTVRDDLVPTADRVRRRAEQRMVRASGEVSGAAGPVAIAAMLAALAVLVVSTLLLAGRTRRLIHPALAAASVVLVGNLVVVSDGLLSQRRELRAAARTEMPAYIQANAAAFLLFDLRSDEMEAVAARGEGAPRYARFHRGAAALAERLDGRSPDGAVLLTAVRTYTDAVAGVEALDAGGDNRAAADATLAGASAIGYREARGLIVNTVDRSAADLATRFDAAAAARVDPALPVGSGLAAAVLAAAGVWARGRRYR